MAYQANNHRVQVLASGSQQQTIEGISNNKNLGLNLNFLKKNPNVPYDSRFFSKEPNILSSPILQGSGQFQTSSSLNANQKMFLSPREQPNVAKNQGYSSSITYRESSHNPILNTASQLGPVKNNNFFKNQLQPQLQKRQQDSLILSNNNSPRAGTAAVSPQRHNAGGGFKLNLSSVPLIKPVLSGETLSPLNSQQQKDPLHQHIRALQIQHQNTVIQGGHALNEDLIIPTAGALMGQVVYIDPTVPGGRAKNLQYSPNRGFVNGNESPGNLLIDDGTAEGGSGGGSCINNTTTHTLLGGEDPTAGQTTMFQMNDGSKAETMNQGGTLMTQESTCIPTQLSVGSTVANMFNQNSMMAGGQMTGSVHFTNRGSVHHQDQFLPAPPSQTQITHFTPQTPFSVQNWQTQGDVMKPLRYGGVKEPISQKHLSPFNHKGSKVLTANVGSVSPTRRTAANTTAFSSSANGFSGNNINLDEITPEIAAHVVRNYLLPMFESDIKKGLRGKKNADGQTDPNSVYGQLKLSEQLQLEIYALREEKDNLREQVEMLCQRNKELELQVGQLTQSLQKTKLKFNMTSMRIKSLEEDKLKLKFEKEKLEQLNSEALNLASVSETYRKQFASKLQSEKVINEKNENLVIELRYRLSVNQMESDIMGDQLKSLYDAINFLGDGKKQADKKQFELNQVVKKCEDIGFEKGINDQELQATMSDRDKLRVELKELAGIMKKNSQDKERLLTATKEKIAQIEDDLKKATIEAHKFQDDFLQSDKLVKSLQNERDKMRQRIQKLKNRRNFNINQKICKLCGKEYLEKENFNWSCRTHRSEFGGEMWWCCGKSSKDAPGCKFSKHFSKEDEDEDGNERAGDDAEAAHQRSKNVRCLCCKEKGHQAQECPRDPNLRTQQDIQIEEKRLSKAKDFRKLLSDSINVTSRLFRGLIRRAAGTNEFNPFSVGSMSFDDYSYKYFNEIVLNPKAIKALNEEEEDNQLKQDKYTGGNGGANAQADESILTADQIKDFEQMSGTGELNEAGQNLGDFLPKEVSIRLSTKSLQSNIDQTAQPTPGSQVLLPQPGVVAPQSPAALQQQQQQNHQINQDSENEGSGNEEEEENAKAQVNLKPKLTAEQIEELRLLQENDPFDDVLEIKQDIKLQYISSRPSNFIDLTETVKELQRKNMLKSAKSSSKQLRKGAGGSNNEGQSQAGVDAIGGLNDWNLSQKTKEQNEYGGTLSERLSNPYNVGGDQMPAMGELVIDYGGSQLKDIMEASPRAEDSPGGQYSGPKSNKGPSFIITPLQINQGGKGGEKINMPFVNETSSAGEQDSTRHLIDTKRTTKQGASASEASKGKKSIQGGQQLQPPPAAPQQQQKVDQSNMLVPPVPETAPKNKETAKSKKGK